LGEPWNNRVQALSARQEEAQSIIEEGVFLAMSEALRVVASTLEKPV